MENAFGLEGCLNNYKADTIERQFCESEESMSTCERCSNYIYDSKNGEIRCALLDNMNKAR